MAKALMILGTGSGAGKSLIAASFCRIFKDMGMKVAPFKAQNMALNSFITSDGGEIGRAQALQAEAARVEPSVDMNPILLKASGEMGSQVIIHGRVHSMMKATQYYAFRKEAWEAVKDSYRRLSDAFEMIVLEGAGSPAEINLMDVDIVNIAMAKHAKAASLLVGDIDRGGVFASLYGTAKLLGRDKKHIKAFVINKFRGDIDILKPGLDMIKEKTAIPVLGVLPYLHDLGLPEEDGLALSHRSGAISQDTDGIKVVVVRHRFISNFTDFDPLGHEPDVELIYSTNPSDIENADLVIIPGSKNTVKDLLLMRQSGIDKSIRRAFDKGIEIAGICGGYQMLGEKVLDPHHAESSHEEVEGIGLLDIETIFERDKTTRQVEAELSDESWLGGGPIGDDQKSRLKGYEIHMGKSRGAIGLFKISPLNNPSGSNHNSPAVLMDGAINKNCWGTYLHGIFDNNSFRRRLLNRVRRNKGLGPLPESLDYAGMKEKAIDRLASLVSENLDMEFIKRMLKL